MNVLIASSEVVPFAKTGGLADVCGALPIELAELGHHPVVFMPAYRCAFEAGQAIEETDIRFDIPIGNKIVPGRLFKSRLPGSEVDIYLVDQPEYYDRAGLYRDADGDFQDNCARYVFFCRAVMESIRMLDLKIDILHCNDWPTGLLPAFLELEYRHADGYESIASILTIHNIAYQGSFWHWDMTLTGLDWRYFNWHQMEFYGQLNLLKTGIVFSDAITTVSPRYAHEIQTPEFGCGLEGVLTSRREHLSGIINGVDYGIWNPETDSMIAQNYSASGWMEGKAACKAELQRKLRLPESPGVPLVGLIGRLAEQKGWELVIELMESWSQREDVQWAILGTGDDRYHHALQALAAAYPNRVSAQLTFSNELAHQIEAGSDIFLMPSRYEPCGLNQLYSLRYGTLPVVHETGGLADTIVDANPQTIAAGTATGFSFHDFHASALQDATRRATDMFHRQPEQWRKLVENAMNQDWSWAKSGQQYSELYRQTLDRKLSVQS